MNYRRSASEAVKLSVRNVDTLAITSTLFTAASVPLLSSIVIGPPYGWVVGLWMSSLLWGVLAVGGITQYVDVVDRGTRVGRAAFWTGMRRGWKGGLVVGIGTFAVAVVTIVLLAAPVTGFVGLALALFGVYLGVGWFALASFALPSYDPANGNGLRFAFAAGLDRSFRDPTGVLWFLVQAAGWSILLAFTLVGLFILLPGFLLLLAAASVANVDTARES